MGDFIPIIAIVFTMMIPIVAILTHHQRKMAELIHGNHNQQQMQDPRLLGQADPQTQAELRQLKDALAQQAIALDNLAQAQEKLAKAIEQKDDIRQRLSSNG